MKTWRAWVAGLATVLIAGCGGGGDAGTPILGQPPAPTAAKLSLVLSSATIPNTTDANVTATVTALDANNNALANIPVTLSVNSNATVAVPDTKTGADGKLAGTVQIGSDRTLRTITVTAKSGSLTESQTLQVIEATNQAPKASDLILTLAAPTLPNSGTQTIKATVIAVDANRNTVADIPVTISVDSAATVQVDSTVTNASGVVTGDVGIGADKSNRVITVTAKSGTLTKTAVLQVTGAQVRSTLLPAVLAGGQTGKIQYRLLDVSGNPVAQRTITIEGVGGVQTVGTTDANGDYEYTYSAPSVAGEITIRATALGVTNVSTVLVQTGPGTIPPVTTPVQSASVSASPSVVPVNTATTKNQASIRALFLGALNKPVPNIRVRFDLDGDKQSIGGTFTSGTTMVYSDASGVATTSYVPANRLSPTDGVTVRACWDYGDFAAGTCPHEAKTTLTVISESLSVTVGTNLLIGEDSTTLKYVSRYVVQVVDSSGLAAADVQISASVDLLQYYKGFWQLGLDPTGKAVWVRVQKAECDNEDLNRNGISEVFANGTVEDANNSFNLTNGRPALEPRKADVAVSFEGSSKTSTSGSVVLRVEYPKNLGGWVRFNLVVGASGVAGTEGRANFVTVLPVPASDVNRVDAAPPFIESPYGVQESPRIEASEPGANRPPAMLCQNPL